MKTITNLLVVLSLLLLCAIVSADSEYCTPSTGVDVTIDHQGIWYNITIVSNTCPFCIDSGTGLICAACLTVSTTSFTTNSTCGIGSLPVQFTDTSTSGPISYYWEFGDGNTSTIQNPEYTYIFPGRYTINHSSTNLYGTTWSNKTNLLAVGVEGTFCSGGAIGAIHGSSSSSFYY